MHGEKNIGQRWKSVDDVPTTGRGMQCWLDENGTLIEENEYEYVKRWCNYIHGSGNEQWTPRRNDHNGSS